MSHTQISISSTSTITPSTLRERCRFTLTLSFAPAFPTIRAKGHIGPTAGNIPRRRRSSAASSSLEAHAAAPIVEANAGREEYFAMGTLHARYKVPPFTSRAHEGFAELGWSARNTLALQDAPHDTFAWPNDN
ncbi:hypothetical protein B0H14DRAFT_3462215 [Mycena olivaceomarginata]|nr:hypothetical protein B0H14DRAFT_3462215 [Mycena olivaceomarginata]